MDTELVIELVLLVTLVNVAPVLASLLLRRRWNTPLDGGSRLADGQPVLGPGKTIRGVVVSVLAAGSLAPALGFTVATGAGFACLAMLGDVVSSFLKRRLGLASGRSVPLLDQLPESLLPLGMLQSTLGASMAEILVAAALFTAIDLLLSRLRKIVSAR